MDIFPEQIPAGKHIGIYEHCSVRRDIYLKLFTKLGGNFTSVERTNIFVRIDTETETDQQKLRYCAKEYGFDAIFSNYGDGNRPLMTYEKGNCPRVDIVGLLCAKALDIRNLA